ncbi:MAG: signal recognition particle-docking protein FtsY [Candidatus Neomarinimicrobiota bacterium]|nr:signal recognition particle-docking protein FtsY [Candidatus Neomarinimicrobiota bacterium]
MLSILKKTFKGLSKTRERFKYVFGSLVGKKYLSNDDIEFLEECLIQADIGWKTTDKIIDELKKPSKETTDWGKRFYSILSNILNGTPKIKNFKKVIMIVGINGTGKTTTSAKLSAWFKTKGENSLLVAADTYRAAAVEQLRQWSKKLNFNLIANEKSSDPASVAYDGLNSGLSKNYDRIIIDTAGRLHTSENLMQELVKIKKVVNKLTDDLQIFMTIDANTGQNALNQTKEFTKYIDLDGIILTKMDGTAKGGIAVPIMLEQNLPVYFIGVGEKADDLILFDQDSYVNGLISTDENN